jgi:hypothetical protein
MNDLKTGVMTIDLKNYEELHQRMYEVQKAKIAYKEAIEKVDEFISNTISNRNTDSLNAFNQMKEYSRAYHADACYTDMNDYKWQALIANVSGEIIKSV